MLTRVVSCLLLVACCLLTGCQQKMADQPSYHPLQPSSFFPDGRSARPLVQGTIARGHLRIDTRFFTGHEPDTGRFRLAAYVSAWSGNPLGTLGALALEKSPVTTFPSLETLGFQDTRQLLERGRQRYGIFCVLCHDPLGTGHGKIVERGYTAPPSYHTPRLRKAPVGHFFDVVTNGYGSMPDHREQIPPRDRWAIIAYIRALQLSQHAPLAELPEEDRQRLRQSQGEAGQ
jgi:hypothetical protein